MSASAPAPPAVVPDGTDLLAMDAVSRVTIYDDALLAESSDAGEPNYTGCPGIATIFDRSNVPRSVNVGVHRVGRAMRTKYPFPSTRVKLLGGRPHRCPSQPPERHRANSTAVQAPYFASIEVQLWATVRPGVTGVAMPTKFHPTLTARVPATLIGSAS